MKIPLRSALVITALSALAPSAARAQMIEPMRFTTTFPFVAGHTNFEPGTYLASPVDSAVVRIQGVHGGPSALLIGIGEIPRHDPAKSEVTFVREGSRMVLKSLWDEGDQEGLDVQPKIVVTANAN
jgi:hypothetical protein